MILSSVSIEIEHRLSLLYEPALDNGLLPIELPWRDRVLLGLDDEEDVEAAAYLAGNIGIGGIPLSILPSSMTLGKPWKLVFLETDLTEEEEALCWCEGVHSCESPLDARGRRGLEERIEKSLLVLFIAGAVVRLICRMFSAVQPRAIVGRFSCWA